MGAARHGQQVITVVIAEDEELIRRGLQREIPWAALGLTVAGVAADGREAAELCRRLRPDILLTDIRMPRVDGLELIETVRRESPATACLIISGYNDFGYAQRAISLGVSHYFLKPLELDDMEAKLREVSSRILEQRRRSEEQRLADDFVADVLPFLRRQFFLELLYGPYGEQEVSRQLALRAGVEEDSWCAAVLAQVALGRASRRNESVERTTAETLRAACLAGPDIYMIRRSGESAQFVAILLGVDCEELSRGRERCLDGLRGLACVQQATAGSPRRGLSRLHESFVEARRDLLLQTLLARGGRLGAVAADRDSGGGQAEASAEALAGIEKAAVAGDIAALEKWLDSLEASLPRQAAPEETRTQAIVAIFGALDRVSAVRGIQVEDALRHPAGPPAYDRGETGLQDLLLALKSTAREAAAGHSTRRELPARHLIDKARRYIEGRFASWDLTLEEVAEHVELNPSYFSTMFKSVTQVNYIDYLTGLRMEKARELLEGSRVKIGAVAQLVGFQSPGYFGYLFKKHFGVTPSQYKAGLEAGESRQGR